jgi:hypothetical protein
MQTEVTNCVKKSRPLDPTAGKSARPYASFNIRSDIIVPPTIAFSKRSLPSRSIDYTFVNNTELSRACYIIRPSHPC